MADRPLRTGDRFGPYRLDRLIGRGGMGEVYEAYDTVKDRTVALKILIARFATDPVYRQRFAREAHSAARLKEAHVIPIHDYGEIDGHLFLDMRLVEGRSLRELLARNGSLAPDTAIGIVGQIASALDAAHRDGLVHRDVKPDNILVAPDDFAYLVDFGIANSATDERLTEVGGAVGSYAYMAPERFEAGPVTPAADIYALTCVLYECVAGRRPFRGTTDAELVRAHLFAPPPSASAESGAPTAFDAVIARGLAKDPAARYPTAGALTLAARDAFTATRVSAPPPPPEFAYPPTPFTPPQPQAAPPPKRARWIVIGAAVVAAAVVAGGALALRGNSDTETTSAPATLDIGSLDPGKYPTEPRRFTGRPSIDEARTLEAFRLGEALVNPYEIDPALDHLYGLASPDPAIAATSIAGTGTPVTQSVMEQFGMISAYQVQGYTKRIIDAIRNPEGNALIVLVMSYPNDAAAQQAATAIDAADFAVNSANERVLIPGYPAAHAHYRPGYASISASLARRNLVVTILAGVVTASGVDDLSQRIQDVLDAQIPLLDQMVATPEAALTTLPLDPDRMLSRTFTADDQRAISPEYGSQGPRAAVTCESSQAVRDRLFEVAGVDRCALSPDSQLLRTRDEAAARDLLPAIMAAESAEFIAGEIDSPAGVPDARCFEQREEIWADSATTRFVCGVVSGKYVAYVWSDDEQDVRERAAAQYAILANS